MQTELNNVYRIFLETHGIKMAREEYLEQYHDKDKSYGKSVQSVITRYPISDTRQRHN